MTGLMEWWDKADRLLKGRTAAHIEREAGWSTNSLRTSIKRGSMPGANLGIKLARVLGVPAEWLFDDDADWPPPPSVGGLVVADEKSRAAILAWIGHAFQGAAQQQLGGSIQPEPPKGGKPQGQK